MLLMLLKEIHQRIGALREKGDQAAVIAECDRLLTIAPPGEAKAFLLRQKGIALGRESEHNLGRALVCFQEAMEEAQSFPAEMGAALSNIVTVYSLLGACRQCEKHTRALGRLVRRHDSPKLRQDYLIALYNLAYVYDFSERLEEAATTYSRVLALADGGFPSQKAVSDLAFVYLRQHRLTEAGRALQMALSFQNTGIEAHTLNVASAYHLALGDIDTARTKAFEAMEHPTCTAFARGQILLTLAQIELDSGNRIAAKQLAEEAQDTGREIPSSLIASRASSLLQSLAVEGVS